jgi:hypothetical protein
MVAKISRLIDEHPQLKEKAIVDLINGIEVNNDHIRVAKKIMKLFLDVFGVG